MVTPAVIVPSNPNPIYFPAGTQVIGVNRFGKALSVILGVSGVGKSHLCKQLLEDADYGKDEVAILMAEDATATYGHDNIHVRQCFNFNTAMDVANDLARATTQGKRLPKVVFVDSISGMADYQRQLYKDQPKMTWSDKAGGQVEDKRAEFGELGYTGMDVLIRLRDSVAADVVVLCTTHEGAFNATPELAIEGKLIPKNITRLSSMTFYMKAFETPWNGTDEVAPAPHRTIVPPNPAIQQAGKVINRYFLTMNTGEVMAKGHHSLAYQERAILPDVLRKIHGKSSLV